TGTAGARRKDLRHACGDRGAGKASRDLQRPVSRATRRIQRDARQCREPEVRTIGRQGCLRTSGSKSGTRIITLLVSLDSEVRIEIAASACELRNRDTSHLQLFATLAICGCAYRAQ